MTFLSAHPSKMDSIKKKMEKLANETNEAEMRIAHFEDIKAANELEVAVISSPLMSSPRS